MADLVLATFDWVPEMPRGFVRDLRVRWALEEAGLSKVRRAFYRALAETGIGREAVIIATKP